MVNDIKIKKGRTIPFGYKVHKDQKKILYPIRHQLEILNNIKQKILDGTISLRAGSIELEKKTRKYLSFVSLGKMMNKDYPNWQIRINEIKNEKEKLIELEKQKIKEEKELAKLTKLSAQNRINKKCITCSKVKLLKEFTLLNKYRASYCKDCNKLILIKSPKIIKKCTKCKKNKSLDKFSGYNGLKAFKAGLCIECQKIIHSQWKKNNRDKVNQYQRKWKLENPEKYIKQRDRYLKKYAQQIKKKQIGYRKKNKEKIRKDKREYYWNVIKNDPIKLKKHRKQSSLSAKLLRIKYPEKFRVQDREYYKKNREKRIENVKKWKEMNPSKVLKQKIKDYLRSNLDIKKKSTLW